MPPPPSSDTTSDGPGQGAAMPGRWKRGEEGEIHHRRRRRAQEVRGPGPTGSVPWAGARPDLATHPRAAFAARIRDQPRVLGYPAPRRALAVISQGIAGLTELSFELEPGRRGQGASSTLVRDALTAVPSGQLVLAAVAPGNAASVRALLSAGFAPLGSLQLFRRAGHHSSAATRREQGKETITGQHEPG